MHVENYKMQMREIKDSPSVECGARRPAALMDQDIQHRKDATAPKPINRLHTMPIETLVRFFYTDEVTYIIL